LKLLGYIFACLIAGGFGAILVVGILSINIDANLQYTDFVSILLSLLAVILTALAIMIGIASFIGWNSISRGIENSTIEFLSKESEDGGKLEDMVRKEVREYVYAGFDPIPEGSDATESPYDEDK